MNTLISQIQSTSLKEMALSTNILDADYVRDRLNSLDNRLSGIDISNSPTEAEQISAIRGIIRMFTRQEVDEELADSIE